MSSLLSERKTVRIFKRCQHLLVIASFIILTPYLASCTSLSSFHSHPVSSMQKNTSHESIERFIRSHIQAMIHQDIDTISRHYTEKAILWLPFQASIKGKTAITQWFKERWQEDTVQKIDHRFELLYVGQDVAYCALQFKFHISSTRLGVHTRELRSSYFLEKGENSEWQIAHVSGSLCPDHCE